MSDIAEDQFERIFRSFGLEDFSFLPARKSTEIPAIGPDTRYILAQPYLGTTASELERRGATRIEAPMPLGEEGTTAWLRAIADTFDVASDRFDAITEPGRERAKKAVAHYRDTLEGKRVFLFPDSQLEPAIARFLHREAGADIIEVGTPFLHRRHTQPEFELLPDTVAVSEGQDVDKQIDRCRDANPDLIVCGMGLGNPFEAEGWATKWSIELVFSPIHGYDQAGDLAELFARPLKRRAALEVAV